MSIELITALMFCSLFVGLLLGQPLAFVLSGLGLIYSFFLWGPNAIGIVALTVLSAMDTIVLVAVPLFIFMSIVLERSGVADELYTAMHRWFAGLKGGLGIGTVLICTLIAAMSGLSATGVITMGLIALPAMLKRKYSKSMAIGCVMGAGALGQLIPPSGIMIVFGAYAGESVGRLFAGGVFPGLVISALFCTYIAIRCAIQPNMGPALPVEERANWRGKLVSLRGVILPIILIAMVLGSIFLGMATPTEAASIGAVGSLLCAAIHGRLNWEVVKGACARTLRSTCMCMFIIIGAKCFASVYTALGGAELIQSIVLAMPGGKWGSLALMQVVWLFLGCFLDGIGILMLTGPVFVPVARLLGFNITWFGVVFVVNMEMGFLTPPFGFNLFIMKGIAPEGVTLKDIYRSTVPFLLLQFTGLILVILFPQLILWLPTQLYG